MTDTFLDDATEDDFEVLSEVDGIQICRLRPQPLNLRWHKRVPSDMAFEYVAKGWKIWKREGRNVVIVWPKAGAPE